MGKKYQIGNVCLFIDNKYCSYRFSWMTMAGRKQNMTPMRKIKKLVDLGDPTAFLDHENVGCIQRQGKPNETIIDEYRKCSNREYLLEQSDKLPVCEKLHAKTVAWSYDVEGHAKKKRCVERY